MNNLQLIFVVIFFSIMAQADYERELEMVISSKLSSEKCGEIIGEAKPPPESKDHFILVISSVGHFKEFKYKTSSPVMKRFWECIESELMRAQFPKPKNKKEYTFSNFIDWSAFKKGEFPRDNAKDKIKEVMKNKVGIFQSCYRKYLSSGGSREGQVVVKWTIEQDGKISNIEVKKDDIIDSNLNGCLADAIKQLEFPESLRGSIMEIENFPFIFKKSSASK